MNIQKDAGRSLTDINDNKLNVLAIFSSNREQPQRAAEIVKPVGAQNASPSKAISPRTATTRQNTRTSMRSSARSKNRRCGRKKNMMDKNERKALIENDIWAGKVTAISVGCRGCGKTVSLDKRSVYYPGLWIKHRRKCPEIRRFEGRADGQKPNVIISLLN